MRTEEGGRRGGRYTNNAAVDDSSRTLSRAISFFHHRAMPTNREYEYEQGRTQSSGKSSARPTLLSDLSTRPSQDDEIGEETRREKKNEGILLWLRIQPRREASHESPGNTPFRGGSSSWHRTPRLVKTFVFFRSVLVLAGLSERWAGGQRGEKLTSR